jgi:hypothetical protein
MLLPEEDIVGGVYLLLICRVRELIGMDRYYVKSDPLRWRELE